MNFFEAIESCFRKYFTVQGRALRSEYWYFQLFLFLVDNAFTLLSNLIESVAVAQYVDMLAVAFVAVTFIPGITVSVRRLHDGGHSGWILLWMLTIVAIPVVLFCQIRKGDPGPNAYGDPVLPPDDEPSSPNPTASSANSSTPTAESSPEPSPATQPKSRDGVNVAPDLRDTTK